MRRSGLSASIEVVEQAERVVPLQGHVVVLEPRVGGRDVGIDQVAVEESVELGQEECQVGESRDMDLQKEHQHRLGRGAGGGGKPDRDLPRTRSSLRCAGRCGGEGKRTRHAHAVELRLPWWWRVESGEWRVGSGERGLITVRVPA